jgi:SAM-dependent methyltransferase
MSARLNLFLISFLILFVELACIRWFPAHVLFLTFFTNTVLLACFVGMSIGCLCADRRRTFLTWTPLLLVAALGAAHAVELERRRSGSVVDVGGQASPQMVYFGTEYALPDPSRFTVPIEVLCGFFFVVIALAFVGPGQHLGRALAALANRVEAYTINILGSIAGIGAFALCSEWQLSPIWWFGIAMAGLGWLLMPEDRWRGVALGVAPGLVLLLAGATGPVRDSLYRQQWWSPYYRIDYEPVQRLIAVNLIGHQQMVSRQEAFPAYALPHLLNRDAGGRRFAQVLIIGAGSGNDVSRALEWGAERVDAVEIDPVIQRLGAEHHPDQPYADPRVIVHLDDGRNFLKSTNRQYDLIVYALVDSLVLHSSYSNIRLESYLFTQQAIDDVRKRLRPGGVFVMYNYFRQGWLVSRLQHTLQHTFGAESPIVLNLPARETVEPDQILFGEFTMLIAGDTEPLRRAFAQTPRYWLRRDRAPDGDSPNGFAPPDAPAAERDRWLLFHPTRIVASDEPLRAATDDWPFLYLRRPMIPDLSVRGMMLMGTLAALMLAPVVRFRRNGDTGAAGHGRDPSGTLVQMFFLGAGFMLIETKAVVHMALLFGGTWVVNSVVFMVVLLMILSANLFVLLVRPQRMLPWYVGLFTAIAVNALVPMDAFLGLSRTTQIAGACLVAFAPILFAGVIFAVSFSQAREPDRAFGLNVAGAMCGGLAEYASMLLGFQYLLVVAAAFYGLSAIGYRSGAAIDRPAGALSQSAAL